MQSGPGTENAFGGVAQAYADSVPIVVLAAGHDRREMNDAAQLQRLPELPKRHQVDRAARAAGDASCPTHAPRLHPGSATAGRGRCLVEIPCDVWDEDVPGPVELHARRSRSASAPDPADVARAARALVAAERPIIYAGQGVHYAEALATSCATLAELLEAPVTTSLEGKSAFPEDHPLSLGSGGRTVPRPVDVFLSEADLVFGIGCQLHDDRLRPPVAGRQDATSTRRWTRPTSNKVVPVEIGAGRRRPADPGRPHRGSAATGSASRARERAATASPPEIAEHPRRVAEPTGTSAS